MLIAKANEIWDDFTTGKSRKLKIEPQPEIRKRVQKKPSGNKQTTVSAPEKKQITPSTVQTKVPQKLELDPLKVNGTSQMSARQPESVAIPLNGELTVE